MNILTIFEDRVSAIFETTAQGFRAPFSFKKLAKQVFREMDKETFVIEGVDTAPALYTILISPADEVAVRPFYLQVATELQQLIEAQAERKGAVFVGEPLVRFIADQNLRSGKFAVFAENIDPDTLLRLRVEEDAYLEHIGFRRPGRAQAEARARAQAQAQAEAAAQAEAEAAARAKAEAEARAQARAEAAARAEAEAAAKAQAEAEEQAQAEAQERAAQARAEAQAQAIPVAPTVRRVSPVQPGQPGARRVPSLTMDPEASGDYAAVTPNSAYIPPLSIGAEAMLPAAGSAFGSLVRKREQRMSATYEGSVGLFGRHPMGAAAENESELPLIQSTPQLELEQQSESDPKPAEQLANQPESPAAPAPASDDPLATRLITSQDASTPEPAQEAAAPIATCTLLDHESHRAYSITAPSASLGRDRKSNDVVLADPNCSRHHAELRWDGERWHIIDLDSTNGTLVNDSEVSDCVLTSGDVITLGLIDLEFREVAK